MESFGPMILMLLKVTCVLLLALCATLAMQRASAGSRHLVWLTALAALLFLPVLAAWSPLPLRVLPAFPVPAQPVVDQVTPPSPVPPGSEKGVAGDAAQPLDTEGSGRAEARPADQPATRWSAWTLVGLVWGGVAALLLAWLAVGAWQVRRIVRRARELEAPEWQGPLYEIADRMGLDEAPRLVRSEDVKMPFAAGLLRTTIVLPSASDEWNTERRSAVLIHELGHVRRRDLVGHTLGRVACALYWFHPLVWTAARRLRAESERACDDLALEYGTRPSEYAEHLLDIVTCVRDHRTPAIALAMAHRKEFEGRMLAILNPDLRRTGMTRFRAVLMAGTLAMVAVLVGAAGTRQDVRASGRSDDTQQQDVRTSGRSGDTQQQDVRTFGRSGDTEQQQVVRTPERPNVRTPERPNVRTPEPRTAVIPDSGSPDERAALLARTLRSDTSADVRRIAAWGLEKYADLPVASEALVAALTSDRDADVREMAAWALSDAKPTPAVIGALQRATTDANPELRRTATWALGNIGNESVVAVLAPLLTSADADTREMAAWGIGNSNVRTAPPGLTRLLSDPDKSVRKSAAWALYSIEDPKSAPAIAAAFDKETDPEVRTAMIRAIGATGDESVEVLQKLVTSPDLEVRKAAISALAGGHTGGPWPWPRPMPRPFP